MGQERQERHDEPCQENCDRKVPSEHVTHVADQRTSQQTHETNDLKAGETASLGLDLEAPDRIDNERERGGNHVRRDIRHQLAESEQLRQKPDCCQMQGGIYHADQGEAGQLDGGLHAIDAGGKSMPPTFSLL